MKTIRLANPPYFARFLAVLAMPLLVALLWVSLCPFPAHADIQSAESDDYDFIDPNDYPAPTYSSAEVSDDGVDYGWLWRKGDYWYRLSQYPNTEPFSVFTVMGTDGEYVWDWSNIGNYPEDKHITVNEILYNDGVLVYQRGPHLRLESVVGSGYSTPWGNNPASIGHYDHLYKTLSQTSLFSSFAKADVFPHIAAVHNGLASAAGITLVEFDETLDSIWGHDYGGPNGVWRSDRDRLIYLDRWFQGCSNLRYVRGFEHINTGDVLDMSYLFDGCTALEELDLTSLDTRNCKNFFFMFHDCCSLTTLKLGENWSQEAARAASGTSGSHGLATFPIDMTCEQNGETVTYREGTTIPDGPGVYTVANRVGIWHADVQFREPTTANPDALAPTVTREYTGSAIRPEVVVTFGNKQLVQGRDYLLTYTNNVEDGGAGVTITGVGDYYGKDYASFTIEDTGAYAFLYTDGRLFLKANHKPVSNTVVSTSTRLMASYRMFDASTPDPGSAVPWAGNATTVKSVVIDPTFERFELTALDGWFAGCSKLRNVTGLEYLNTNAVKSAAGMFKGCLWLESMPLYGLDLPQAEDVSGFFEGCSSLKSASLTNLKLTSAVNLSGFFKGCTSLTSVSIGYATWPAAQDLSDFFNGCRSLRDVSLTNANLPAATNLERFFSGCSSLRDMSLASANLPEATRFDGFFEGCKALETMTFTDANLPKAQSLSGLFADCAALKSMSFAGADLSGVTDLSGFFRGCTKLSSMTLADAKLSSVKNMSGFFEGCKALRVVSLSGISLPSVTDMSGFFENCASLDIASLAGLKLPKALNLSNFFKGCTALHGASISGISMPKAQNLSGFFQGCASLDVFSFSGAKLPAATNLSNFFQGCKSLGSISMTGADLSAAKNLSGFFGGCAALGSVSMTNADLSSATDLSGFFSGCTILGSMSLANVKLPKAQNLSNFFSGCSSLEIVTLAGADLSSVTDISGFFKGCTALETVSLEGATIPKVRSLAGLFGDCARLRNVTLKGAKLTAAQDLSGLFAGRKQLSIMSLEGADLSAATNLDNLFSGCTALDSVALSGVKLSAATSLAGMFQDCTALKTLSLEGLKLPAATNLSNLFKGCTALESASLKGMSAPRAQNLSGFFQGCTALVGVDATGASFPVATNLGGFFSGCKSLVNLDIAGLSAPKATNVAGFLAGCTSLETLTIGGLASAGKADMSGLLAGCPKIATLTTAPAFRNATAAASKLKFASRAYRTDPSYARQEASSAVPNGAGEYRLRDLAMQFAKVVMQSSKYTCTGKAIKPAVKVMLGDVELQKGEDYTLTYKNNVYPGKASVTIRGKGALSGGLVAPFKVVAQTTKAGDRLVYETDEVIYTVQLTKVTKKNGVVKNAKATLVDVRVKAGTLKSMSIPDACTVGGIKITITEVNSKLTGQFKNVRNVWIGPKVVKIGARAFAKAPKVKKLFVKSARLKSVKNCLKGSKVKEVETRVHLSTSKQKTYKKWFTKKSGKTGVTFTYGIYASLVF